MKVFNEVTSIIGICGGFIVQYLGGFDLLLQSLVVLIIVDWATGIMKAVDRRQLSADRGLRGIFKKMIMLFLLAMAVVMENVLGGSLPVREMVLMFLIGNEGISILENVVHFIEVPEKLKDILLSIRGNE